MNLFPFLTIFCICFRLSIFPKFCLAADTIALNQSISDGPDGLTLVSPGQRFELGFFSPGRSKKRYLAIWYKTTPDVVVWVANRNTPLSDSQGIFAVSSNGKPVLLNSTNSIIWSANVSREAASPVVQLLDTGNLVLVDNANMNLSNYLWQSFDYPGNTRLPGMLTGENLETGRELYLTSWRNTNDPSTGDFIYRVENHVMPQVVLSSGTGKRFRTGPWNGIRFNGLPMFPNPVRDTVMVFNNGRSISISDPYNSSVISRLTLNQSGTIQAYILDGKKNEWNVKYTIPSNPCDSYGQCGHNGVCNTNKSPMCRCLKGFTPRSQQEWELLDWSSGCVRVEPPNCQNGDRFLNVSGIKLPDMLQSELKMNMSLNECEAECFRNCSCTAYTNPYVGSGKSSCLMWYGDLVDIREFTDEKNEQNVYIRLPISELESASGSNMKNKKKRPLKVTLISTASGVLFLGLFSGYIVLKVKRKRKVLSLEVEDWEVPLLDIATVMAATRSFSEENIIGQGGFGPVYKGILSTGQEIAVKRLSKDSRQGAKEFKSEVILIAKLQHRNLVRLLGCCIQGEEKMLIYEYLQNKSLDYFTFDPGRSQVLIWPKRFDIMMGIARGLLYLHQDSRLKIIHRDLKASNILLDSNLEPKISDFGLARPFGGDQTSVKTERVIGTYGYMAPEYAIDGIFCEKADVFSFGILLLEIVSGKKNRSFSHPDHHHNLAGHAWLLWNEKRALELMDACLKDSFVASQVKRCIQVGLLCVQRFTQDRPTMSAVLFMLGNEEVILPDPREPGFFIERSSANTETHVSLSESSNTNEMEDESKCIPILDQIQHLEFSSFSSVPIVLSSSCKYNWLEPINR